MAPKQKKEANDIHNYKGRYAYAVKVLTEGVYNEKTKKYEKISKRNADIIIKFDNRMKKEGLSLARRERVISILHILARHFFEKDFDKIMRKDMDKIQDKILDMDYSNWTKQTYFAILKKFYKWLEYGDDYADEDSYPDVVKGLKNGMKKKDMPKIKSSDILTEEEVQKMIDNGEYIRDKAFVSMIYELGARIGEIGNLSRGDCVKEDTGYTINLKGKTGERTPILIFSDNYLTNWLEQHPIKKSDAPLWIMAGDRNKNKAMTYDSLRMLIKRLAEKSKIEKKIHPHIFRHSRVSHLLINGDITEHQAKTFFGWTPDSRQLQLYSHITSADVNNKIKEKYGILKKEDKKPKHKNCMRCNLINPSNSFFCQRCGLALDSKTAFNLKEKENEAKENIKKLLSEEMLDGIAQELSKRI